MLSVFGPSLEADFDEDGDVDGDDLTRWRTNFGAGTTHMQGDADADGHDFLTWQRQLGGPPPAAGAAAAVPEPNGAILAFAGFLAGLPLYRVGILSRRNAFLNEFAR